MFTTAASIAGVKSAIPNDRVTDSVDQRALLLLGEGRSQRDNIFHYDKENLEAVRQMVRRELLASIYRCKGIVYAADHPDKRLTLHVVGRLTEIYELDEWGERKPCTQIVAIGEPEGIDAQELNNKFDAWH